MWELLKDFWAYVRYTYTQRRRENERRRREIDRAIDEELARRSDD